MKSLLIAALGLLLLAPAVRAQAETTPNHLGRKIANVSFHDDKGVKRNLHDLKDHKAVVVVFLSFDCPVSNSYSQPLADLYKVYQKRGVEFIGLTINSDETRADVAKRARDFKIPFPVYLDSDLAAVAALRAEVTPEAFVLDHNFVLRYRGRIDSSYADRLKKHTGDPENSLDQALAELLAGRPIREPQTQAIGCFIDRQTKVPAKTGAVTYYRDALPILQNHCQSCHRPGEVGPFSLMTFKQAVNWAEDIKEYTGKRLMPPWKPSAGVEFYNDRRLSEKDIATLAAWVDGDCAEGNSKDAPPAKTFTEGWQLGTPDLILSPKEDFVLGPNGKDLFRCFVLPTNLPEDTYVSAVELRPGNPRVVHHVLLFIDNQGKGRQLELDAKNTKVEVDGDTFDKGPGYTVSMGVGFLPQGGLGGWAPGNLMKKLPDQAGFFLPKNSDVVMQVHFHRNGRVENERTQVGIYFAKKGVRQPYQTGAISGGSGAGPFRLFFSIPAGAENFAMKGDIYVRDDFQLLAITPHMHMLGKSMKVTLTTPDGKAKTLLDVPDWDYNWQESYFLKAPMTIAAGSQLTVEAVYDNSSKNPRNPFNPPRRITFGEQTNNEMCFAFLGGLSETAGRRLPLTLTKPVGK